MPAPRLPDRVEKPYKQFIQAGGLTAHDRVITSPSPDIVKVEDAVAQISAGTLSVTIL